MDFRSNLSHRIIEFSFQLTAKTINRFSNTQNLKSKTEELRALPDGTLGKDIANYLDENNIVLVKNFESHDLKHIILDLGMTPIEEIRLQAFMIGNGNLTISSAAIFSLGIVLFPSQWSVFRSEFKKGRSSIQIKGWTIDEMAHFNTNYLRNQLSILNVISNNKQRLHIRKHVSLNAVANSGLTP